MKTQLVHVSKLQTAKVMAVMYLVISLPIAVASLTPVFYMHQTVAWGLVLLMPVLYAIFGFIFTFLGAWIYNGIAGWLGGIEFTISNDTAD